MNKKQNNSAILAGIAITAILVASSLIAGNQFVQQAHAQANATSSTPSTTARPSSSSSQQQVRVGQTVNWQGTVSSIPSPLAGHNRENVAVILPLRNDGGLYTGVVTFTSSKGVNVQVWNVLSGVNPSTTTIGRDFGSLAISPSPNGKGFVATTDVGDRAESGSVPFAGNALALVGRAPFIATYSVTAQATAGKVTNNLTSATALAAAAGGATSTLGGATGTLSLGGSSGGGGGSSGAAAAAPTLGGSSGGGGGSSSGGGGGSSSGGGGGSSSGGGGGSSSDDGRSDR
jgi:hypothetical protein